jgi:hypothetical protein
MNTLTKLYLLVPSVLLLLAGCSYTPPLPGYHRANWSGSVAGESVKDFHEALYDALFPNGSHGEINDSQLGPFFEYTYFWTGGFYKDEAAFYKGLKFIFPEYKKHTQRITYREKPADLISFPPEECGSAIVITYSTQTGLVTRVEFVYQDNAPGQCKKLIARAKNVAGLQHINIQDRLDNRKFKGEPPLCSTIPKKFFTYTHDETDSNRRDPPSEWNSFYNQGFCYTDEMMLVHYFYQTSKQVQQSKAEERRQELMDAENERQAEYRRHLRFDPMYDFTMVGPDGKKMRCGRPTPQSTVQCR